MQMPVRERIAELEQKYTQKVEQEGIAWRQEANLDGGLSLLKLHGRKRERGMQGMHGYDDTGREWKALLESMRSVGCSTHFQRKSGRRN